MVAKEHIPSSFLTSIGLDPVPDLTIETFRTDTEKTELTDFFLATIGMTEKSPRKIGDNSLFDETDIYVYDNNLSILPNELTEDEVYKVSPFIDEFLDNGYEIALFKSPTKNLAKAIRENKMIEEVHLAEKIQDTNFRFLSIVDPDVSYDLTESLAFAISKSKISAVEEGAKVIVKKAAFESAKVRNATADEYAINMFSIIRDIKTETGTITVRGLVELLDKRDIETPNGGKWRINTIQSLQKRWRELGLT